jgi:hypothetical protein
VKLINGRGQLGTALNRAEIKDNVTIYHTWNIDDLNNADIQRKCYIAFVNYVNGNKKENIIFISTTHSKDSQYLKYKVMGEAFALDNNCRVIRLPKLIGKGTFQKFREGEKPWDNEILEIMDIDKAVDGIIKFIDSEKQFHVLQGELISKQNIYNLINYGKN